MVAGHKSDRMMDLHFFVAPRRALGALLKLYIRCSLNALVQGGRAR
jgi:hypothetical protein